jgi:hypothetical protein
MDPRGGLRWAQMEFNAEGEEIEIVPNFAQPETDLQFIEVRVNTRDQLASSHEFVRVLAGAPPL